MTKPVGRLVSNLSAFLIVGVALWALMVYESQKSAVLASETTRYLEEFEAAPVSEAWRQLTQAWYDERIRERALRTRFQSSRKGDVSVLGNYKYFILETIAERRLDENVKTVLSYCRRLAICVRVNKCDGHVVATYLGDEAIEFRNRYLFYLNEFYSETSFYIDIDTITLRVSLKNEIQASRG